MIFQLTNRFILLIDVETANTTQDALVYDIGGIVIDIYTHQIYEGFSFTIRDIFNGERELMEQAFYAEKIPEYITSMRKKEKTMIDFLDARAFILNIMKKYNIKTIAAYNCAFDRNTLNTTLRYITKSKMRWFFPYDIEYICIWNMACQTICQTSEYKTFAEHNHYVSNHGKNYRATAETVYAFITNNAGFMEEHKGFEDVNIEHQILKECMKYNDFPHGIGIWRACWQQVKRQQLMIPQQCGTLLYPG